MNFDYDLPPLSTLLVRTAEAFDIDLIDPRQTRPILCGWVRMVYENILPGRLEKTKVYGPRVRYRP